MIRNFIALDVETIGLPADYKAPFTDTMNWPKIISIGYIHCFDGSLAKHHYYIRTPQEQVAYFSRQVHKIPQEMLDGAPPAEDIAHTFLSFLEDWTANPKVMVCHNEAFDRSCVGAMMVRCGFKDRWQAFLDQAAWHCTMLTNVGNCKFRMRGGKSKKYKFPKLEECYHFYTGRNIKGTHDALIDATALISIFMEQQRRYPESVSATNQMVLI